MDGIVNLPLFIVSTILIIIAPGPDFIYVTTRGISEGNRAGVLSALGVGVGLLIHTLFAAFGLSAIIHASSTAYHIIQYCGAAYLVYLGVKMILTKKELTYATVNQNKNKRSRIFNQAIITNVFNPKAIVTFMAFLPQFVDVKVVNPVWQFVTLGLILASLAILWFGFVGYFAGLIGGFIKRSKLFQNILKYLSGSIMIALGIRVALQRD